MSHYISTDEVADAVNDPLEWRRFTARPGRSTGRPGRAAGRSLRGSLQLWGRSVEELVDLAFYRTRAWFLRTFPSFLTADGIDPALMWGHAAAQAADCAQPRRVGDRRPPMATAGGARRPAVVRRTPGGPGPVRPRRMDGI